MSEARIEKLMTFAESLLDVPYTLWEIDESYTRDVFYCDSIPPIEELRSNGINCAGFINLLMLYSGKSIPESQNIALPRGGTGHWFQEFSARKSLSSYCYSYYPVGTLLFRHYRNLIDQGHFAVIYKSNPDPNKVQIIHAYSGGVRGGASGKVGITPLVNSVATKGYYDYAILPPDWIL